MFSQSKCAIKHSVESEDSNDNEERSLSRSTSKRTILSSSNKNLPVVKSNNSLKSSLIFDRSSLSSDENESSEESEEMPEVDQQNYQNDSHELSESIFGKQSTPDLMVVLIYLDIKSLNSYVLVNKKCTDSCERLKINPIPFPQIPMKTIKKFYPNIETLYTVNPKGLPRGHFHYKLYTTSSELLKTTIVKRHVTFFYIYIYRVRYRYICIN